MTTAAKSAETAMIEETTDAMTVETTAEKNVGMTEETTDVMYVEMTIETTVEKSVEIATTVAVAAETTEETMTIETDVTDAEIKM